MSVYFRAAYAVYGPQWGRGYAAGYAGGYRLRGFGNWTASFFRMAVPTFSFWRGVARFTPFLAAAPSPFMGNGPGSGVWAVDRAAGTGEAPGRRVGGSGKARIPQGADRDSWTSRYRREHAPADQRREEERAAAAGAKAEAEAKVAAGATPKPAKDGGKPAPNGPLPAEARKKVEEGLKTLRDKYGTWVSFTPNTDATKVTIAFTACAPKDSATNIWQSVRSACVSLTGLRVANVKGGTRVDFDVKGICK